MILLAKSIFFLNRCLFKAWVIIVLQGLILCPHTVSLSQVSYLRNSFPSLVINFWKANLNIYSIAYSLHSWFSINEQI